MSNCINDTTAMASITIFLSGFTMATFLAASLIFFRIWKKMADRFFLMFSLACSVLAVERIPLLFLKPSENNGDAWVFVFRLTAFVIILVAVLEANRKSRSRS